VTQTRPRGFTLSSATTEDLFTDPELFAGVTGRRSAAFIIDMVIVGAIYAVLFVPLMIFNFVTFGLFAGLTGVVVVLGPYLYSVLGLVSAGGGTPGMRAMGLEVRTLDGQPTEWLQAIVHVGLFWVSLSATAGLVLLVAMFNNRGRTLHDFVSGLIVVDQRAVETMPRRTSRFESGDFRPTAARKRTETETGRSVMER